MKRFIRTTSIHLHQPEADIRKALCGLFSILRQNLDAQEYGQLLRLLPESELLFSADWHSSELNILPRISGLAGSKSHNINALGLLLSSGLTTIQMTALANLLVDHVAERCGDIMAIKVSSSLPDMMKIAA